MSEELKPCPFCGGNAEIERMGTNRVSMQIQCGDCGAGMETGETWINEHSRWNKRTTDQLEQEAMDTIEQPEWVNGDDIEAYGKSYKYVGLDPFNENMCICLANQDDDPQCFSIEVLKKPETPEQKLERDELEAAYELYCKCGIQHKTAGFDKWRDCYTDPWVSIVRETGYRKTTN